MVKYIKSDLEFILEQIKIAERHSAYLAHLANPLANPDPGQPLYGPGGSVPAYNVSWGLRTVDGSDNNLLPGRSGWGAADHEFPSLLPPVYRNADGTPLDMDGPGGAPPMPTSPNYNPSNNPGSIVVDTSLRTISNLIVDQTLDNPAAIMVALQRAGNEGSATDLLAIATTIKVEYQTVKPFVEAAADAHLDNTAAQRTLVAAQQADAAGSTPETQAALAAAIQAAADAQAASDAADAALVAERVDLDAMLNANGIEMQGDNISLPNVAPDEGLSASFNSWFTLFGQFFDHGLDLVGKGNSGTVFVPLQPDDPLYDPASPTNFMVLTRATVTAGPDNVMGTADDVGPINTTTSFVDQNQTYTSHPSHQVFLREYVLVNGRPEATGALLDGTNGGLPTWGEIKAQARNILGIDLTDYHVGNLPLLATDPYGNFIPSASGLPQVVMVGAPPTLASGTPGAPLNLVNILPDGPDANTLPDVVHLAVRTGHAFLDDIAHTAAPTGKLSDGDIEIGLGNLDPNGFYDQALLDAHFITGDGRGNENIGLTAVHHVFHAEHNRLMEHTKETTLADAAAMLASGASQAEAVAFLNEWLDIDVAVVPTTAEQIAALDWDGERLFQAAKFGTEMQYQHLVFEEFARKIQPNVNVFVVPDGYDVTIDPTIVAEFAHVVYRFGHSMLTESIDRLDPAFNDESIGLIEGFLNPIEFASLGSEEMAGSIVRGMTRQVGNEIDEFVTSALRNNLLGLPLDLATINLARGRDTGVPSLNQARSQFYQATNNAVELKPYESWIDFAGALKNEASIINFVAAYGTHSLITTQTTIEGKRDAALTIITGTSVGGLLVPGDAEAFLNGTGIYAAALGGLNNVDLWIGGLAEKITPFGGMLGSTFNFVFETTMEKLQNGDRFYYLQRLDGLHLFSEMEGNSFAAMIMRNTDATHLPSDVFSTPGLILEVDRTKQYNPDLPDWAGPDGVLVDNPDTPVDESADNVFHGADPTGSSILTPTVIRNNPSTVGPDANYLRYTGGEHVVLGGTDVGNAFNPSGNDTLIAGIGDDTLYGDSGNDYLEGGHGNDIINGGAGDDIIRDMGGDDNIKAGDGNDVVHAGPGLDLVLGGAGKDFIFLGTDMGSEVFGGEGDDFIYGNKNAERLLGNEGSDWIETGTFDGAPGDNFDELFARDEIDGHDVFLGDGGFDEFIAEGGDDIMVGSPGRGKMAGMSGWDWVTYKDDISGVDADLTRGIVFDENPTPPPDGVLDAFEAIEGLSGSSHNDVLTGADTLAEDRVPFTPGGTGTEGYRGSRLTKEGVQRITGLQQVLGLSNAEMAALAATAVVYDAGEIILGGDGNDLIMGRAGDDIIDGDKWLDVSIGVTGGAYNGQTFKSMTLLADLMFAGTINPSQLSIVREIKTANGAGDIDVARYQGLRGDYTYGATADGQIVITDITADNLDGSDRLRNIERVRFGDNSELGIVVGTAGPDTLTGTAGDDLILGLAGNDTLNGLGGNDILVGGDGNDVLNGGDGNDLLIGGANGAAVSGQYADNFNTASLGNTTGATNWGPDWLEQDDSGGVTGGQIRIDDGNNQLRFVGGAPAASYNGAQITRTMDLSQATTATIAFTFNADGLDGTFNTATMVGTGEYVIVQFAADGTSFVTLDGFTGDGGNTGRSYTLSGPFAANAAIRFVTTAINQAAEGLAIDDLTIAFSTPAETLNGGNGDDTYQVGVGDGNDIVNEAANGGAADRISIIAPNAIDPVTGLPVIDPATDLPIPTLTGLDAADSNGGTNTGDLVINYSLPTGALTSVTQTITVAGHFTGANAQTGVERINFNGATYAGYLLGPDDYLISRLDPANRNTGGVDLSASIANNFIVGENGTNDEIIGGAGNDLIFGGTGDNDLSGGLGDDLLVGGSGAGDDDVLDGGGDLDTMIGLAGNDTYVVDDLGDVVVEALNAGTDTVQTLMAALSIELMANVENLTYTGADADPFVGTGNALANVITGGDLADTLSGLGGNDTLNGGLGADALLGGDGNDVYIVDEAGDVVTETNADLVTGGTDRVESDIDYTLGANLENLDINGAAIVGRGNALANVINGNDEANQIFGGAGADTLNGDDGNDLIDGGEGDDTINGGNNNDTVIGGTGNDAITVTNGNDLIRYTAVGFGADTITGFDATGGSIATQDLIDLSALGVTAANLGTRVVETMEGTTGVLTVRDAALNTIGVIRLANTNVTAIDATDYVLATAAPPPFGAPTNGANTITGNAAANLIDGLGGADILSGAGGDDVINGGEGIDTLNGGDGNDTLSGGAGAANANHADNFGAVAYGNNNGTLNFAGNWTETGDNNNAATGDILITGGRLTFAATADNNDIVQRSINLNGATAPTLTFSYQAVALDAGETVVVEALNGAVWETLATLGGTGTGTPTYALNPAHTAIRFRATGGFEAGETFHIDDVVVALGPNSGIDTINGDAGDDTIIWNAAAPTDGRDVVDGGVEGLAGDTFVINGTAGAETYRVYTRQAFDDVVGNTLAGINAATEIIVTRDGTGSASIIAELRDIEEIRINGADPSGSGTVGGDTFQLIGDFSGTSLRLNTVTIDGSSGDDTVDISGLVSNHRIVFTSNGGEDTVIGVVRAQDVVDDATYVTPPPPPSLPPRTLTATNAIEHLMGSGGADTFVFPTTFSDGGNRFNRDVISNFVSGQDRIDLSGIDASRLRGSDLLDNDAFASVLAGTNFPGVAEIRYHTETVRGITYTVVRGNIDYDNTPEFEIALTGVHQLTTADFIL